MFESTDLQEIRGASALLDRINLIDLPAFFGGEGNSMGQYIRDRIQTPEHYERFSQDVFEATEQSAYWALAHHVHPYEYSPDAKLSRDNNALKEYPVNFPCSYLS